MRHRDRHGTGGHAAACALRPEAVVAHLKRPNAGALIALLLVLAACTTPLKTRYYTLSGESAPRAEAAGAVAEYRVAIGPVSVPEALDRMQIVLSIGPNRYSISDAERWSEPLKNELPYILAQDVGRRLPAASVATYLTYDGQNADYRVPIDVLRFESVPGTSITLEAAWSVRNRAGARLHEARSVYVEQVHAPGIAPLVAAHAKALGALGHEIAEAVGAISRTRPNR